MTDALRYRELPVGSIGHRANGWWGALTLIATEAALFAYLLFSYYYVAVQNGRDWLPAELPGFKLAGPNTIVLVVSSVLVWLGERAIKRGAARIASLWMAGGALLGAIFVTVQYFEWSSKAFGIATSSYGSLYFTITGFHMMHVIVGVVVLLTLAAWSARATRAGTDPGNASSVTAASTAASGPGSTSPASRAGAAPHARSMSVSRNDTGSCRRPVSAI